MEKGALFGGSGGEPRRHDSFGDYFADHACVFLGVRVAFESERSDTTFTVTLRAMGLQNARYPIVVSQVLLG